MNTDKIDAKILAVAGKGGVGKTSLAAVMVKLLVAAYPDKRILAIDADPAVGLSTALGVDVKLTVDDIRKEVVANAEDGNAKAAIELLGEARYRIFDALVEMDGFDSDTNLIIIAATNRPDVLDPASACGLISFSIWSLVYRPRQLLRCSGSSLGAYT